MPRILVVDDSEDNRYLLSRQLSQRGFQVTTAENGTAAVRQATTDNPQLILMDMNLPELDGWQATEKIRSMGIAIPIIALTAHAMQGDRERAIEAGCTDYHAKPVDLDVLLERIETLLGSPVIELDQ